MLDVRGYSGVSELFLRKGVVPTCTVRTFTTELLGFASLLPPQFLHTLRVPVVEEAGKFRRTHENVRK